MHNLTIVSRMEIWPIERLIPYAANARTHSRKQVWQIARSMREHGVINPVLVDQHGNVIAGHGRILAAQFLGLPHLPVIILDHLSPAQVRALRIADNKIAENAKWDDQKLNAELASLLEEKIDLTALGFEDHELTEILKELESQTGLVDPVDPDAAPELPTKAVTKLGDLWNLGPHRILCADSTVPSNLVRVLEGHPANLIFADLPYNVNYSGSPRSKAKARRRILNDNLGSDFGNFLYDICVAMLAVAGGAIYISMSSSELHTLYKAFSDAGGHWSTYIIWAKDTFTISRSPYQRQFEPVLFGWKEGGAHYFCGARDLGDVWFIDKPRVNDMHPTMKPVELMVRAILHSSKAGDSVLDPVAGSGSTLIACQQTSRRGRLVELDPRYVDVAILRWQDFSGQKATLASTGQSFEEVSQDRSKPVEVELNPQPESRLESKSESDAESQ
ncbi:MAG: putative dna modification methylase protein [Bryobacterales bacterium]|nr:putative dna modification methylase protein [Bryobacterales bacterium]